MGLLVKKFGGTSIKSIERIQAVAKRIAQDVHAGNRLVVVVSAMGKSTDHLVELAKKITPHPDPREMDQLLATGEQVSTALLCIALHQLGIAAVSLTGWQAGIITEKVHAQARIVEVKKEKILSHVEKGRVVVVAGFQGVTEDGEVTTIGRGGSDTSAVVLAAALGAERCDIFTDVNGVYTADPRIVPDARQLRQISCDEMLALARLGAQVLHPRAVACAKKHGVPLTVRSSFHEAEGTRIEAICSSDEQLPVCGIAHKDNFVKVTLVKAKKEPAFCSRLTTVLTQSSLVCDDVITENSREISFFIESERLAKFFAVLDESRQAIESIRYEHNLAKVSVVGAAAGDPKIVSTVQEQLNNASIERKMVITSRQSVSCLIPQDAVAKAANTLHRAFGLDKVREAVLT